MAKKKPDTLPESVAGVTFKTLARQIVLFQVKGEERFGRVCTEPVKTVCKCAARGLLLVSDEIYPVCHELSPDQVKVVRELPWNAENPLNLHRHSALKAAMKASDRVNGFGPGRLFNVACGDGAAWYVVTKVTPRTVAVAWRGYHCDHWRDPVLDWGGVFPRPVIERLVGCHEDLRRIFGDRQKGGSNK